MDSKSAPPARLKLEFSTAADAQRIGRLFDPAVKDAADPQHFVDKRLRDVFNKAVAAGCAATLSDEAGHVQALTVAYHLSDTGAQHDHSEFGSTLSLMQGFQSTAPIIAALALREWFKHPPANEMAAEIRQDNIPSVKIYKEKLGWEVVDSKAANAALNASSWRTIPDEAADPSGNTGLAQVPAEAKDMDWYACTDKALARQASTILEAMKQGGLTNKKTGAFIPVDFSALEKEGLSRARLEALARGVTSRAQLTKIAP